MTGTGNTITADESMDPTLRLITDIDYIFEVTKSEYDPESRCPDFPDSVVVSVDQQEWINAPTAVAWITNKLDVPLNDAQIIILNEHLIKLIDVKKHTFDVFGLKVKRGSHGDRNGIYMEFHVRDEPRSPRPPRQPASLRFENFKNSLAAQKKDGPGSKPSATVTSSSQVPNEDSARTAAQMDFTNVSKFYNNILLAHLYCFQ